jgi:Asp/Glu/hydantoin racemase
MQYFVHPGQVSYGESIGILLLENYAPFVPGDTANATSYRYPVRFLRVPGLSVERIFNHDLSMYEVVKAAAEELKREGVRAITGDCGFMAIYQQRLAEDIGIPVFLSSLLQLSFMGLITGANSPIGVVTANSKSLTDEVLIGCGISESIRERIRMTGLEDCEHFVDAVFKETGMLDTDIVQAAVVERAKKLQKSNPDMGSILLECSMLPPYGRAVQEATGLPVFDYITMIDYVHATLVKELFHGHM